MPKCNRLTNWKDEKKKMNLGKVNKSPSDDHVLCYIIPIVCLETNGAHHSGHAVVMLMIESSQQLMTFEGW